MRYKKRIKLCDLKKELNHMISKVIKSYDLKSN